MPPPVDLTREMVQYQPGAAAAWSSGWSYETASGAARSHMRGCFGPSYQLGTDMWSLSPVKAAREQVIAACAALPWTVGGATRAPGRIEVAAASALWSSQMARLLDETMDDLAMQGFAVWQHPISVVDTDAGPRHVIERVELWPTSCVEFISGWSNLPDGYYAIARGGVRIPLPRPGETDGHWSLIGSGSRPHTRGAIVALDLEYVATKMGRRAMAKLVNVIGKSSVTGTLPPEIKLMVDGALSPEAAQAIDTMVAMGETQEAALFPNGLDVKPFELTSNTAPLWPEWLKVGVRFINWALLGHDSATMEGNVYKDPFSQAVPEDLARRHVGAVERSASALMTLLGSLNAGPKAGPIEVVGHLPDVDQAERVKAENAAREADDKHAAAQLAAGKAAAEQLTAERAAGVVVDEARVASVYGAAGVPVPALATTAPKGAETFAYDLDNGIVTINEQRADKGKPPVPWGDITPPEYKARVAQGWTTSPTGWVPPPSVAPAPTPPTSTQETAPTPAAAA